MSSEIDVSVVIPCLNEEEGIGVCIKKIKDIFSREGLSGEIVISDNGSTDKSVSIALGLGARVVAQPVRGYGAAYLKGLEEAKGRYIVIADGDDTYDFNDILKFIKPLEEGYDYVMGNRLAGTMARGSMPWANRYIGNPVLSSLCRLFFGTKLSDIYCGMRSFTREAYERMHLRCLGMEFAIEMVLEALQKKLKTKEVVIDYFPRKGVSKLRPFQDAWRAARLMILFCPTWLYFIPGIVIMGFGIINLLFLAKGPFLFLGRYWGVHMAALASLLSILGYQIINLGMYAKTFAIQQEYLSGSSTIAFFMKYFNLEIGIIIGLLFFIIGFGINFLIFLEWWGSSFGQLYRIHESIFAMTFMVLGIQTIFSSFFISLLTIRR
jgi:glycosyltransferase involved in cell wall biosynthesis